MLLAEKVRNAADADVIKSALEANLKCKILPIDMYAGTFEAVHSSIVWTSAMKRLYTLLTRALQHNEPVLLIGETGCGKTSAVQMFAAQNKQELHITNCHMHTEPADFIGSMRPVRESQRSGGNLFEWSEGPLVQAMKNGSCFLLDEISLADDSVLERLNSVLEPSRKLTLTESA